MDEKTYSDPEIANSINKNFVPVRVDIDKRPDISERYNRGGFPTTAFLSDQGESIWGATFVPPLDMKRIMDEILRAKESGEIQRALERSRMHFLDVQERGPPKAIVTTEQLQVIFEDIFSAYDVEFGGFGLEPKFPHPDVLDLLLMRFDDTSDSELADAVSTTLDAMASSLGDRVEGGIFRYSVTRDWKTPHYEKMLETNVGFLRNLVHASGTLGTDKFDDTARTVAKYLQSGLRDPTSGGFYGSQDADEEYYRLTSSTRRMRSPPSIDKTVYAGWNAEASAAFALAGIALSDEEMLKSAKASWEYALKHHYDPELGLVRHLPSESIYLFEDQVSFLNAILAQIGLSADRTNIRLGERLIEGVNKGFACDQGGFNDVMTRGDAIGELETPRRPLVQNSNWALALAQFASIAHKSELVDKARATLDTFTQSEIDAHGVFAAAYLRARWAIERGMKVVEVHCMVDALKARNILLRAAIRHYDPSVVPATITDKSAQTPYAVVCTSKGCSRRIEDPEELLRHLGGLSRGRLQPC